MIERGRLPVMRGTPLDLRPWATWKRENLLAGKSARRLGTIDRSYPRFFTSLPILRPLMAWRPQGRSMYGRP